VKEDSVVEYRNPGIALPVADVLTEVLRNGARELLQQAVEAVVAEFVKQHRELKDEHDRLRVVLSINCHTDTVSGLKESKH
jgi:hypothetical protein